METIVITGGTGMIGTALTEMLTKRGYEVILFTRDPEGKTPKKGVTYARWEPTAGLIDSDAIKRADHIIHLAGAGVAEKRWSAKRKKEIVDSRVVTGTLIVKALRDLPNKVKSVISASGIAWYGEDPSIPNPRPFVETDPVDNEFLGEVCRQWEAAISEVTSMNKRLVIFRTGLVLGKEGGALAEFRKPVKMGVAAVLGSGKQIMSWIHIDDICRLYIQAIEDDSWSGAYNAVAPKPVNNKTITIELARRLKGRYYVQVYVPSFLLKMAVGELSVEVLKSATISADKVRKAGFQFIYPTIESALDDITDRNAGTDV